jgi:F0F1-type ATP synthase membrane subunit b/b'
MSRSLRFLLAAVFLACVVAAPAVASEGGETAPENTPLGWTFRVINFLILFAGLLYLMVKKAPAFFRGRAEQIVSAITEARGIKEQAEGQLREAEARLARLEQEVAALRAGAQQDGAAESERIRASGREETSKIARAAEAEIEAAERAARLELRAHAARLAVEKAEAVIRGRMNPEAQARLVRAFVENLERAR